jgi:photosystem II oxygen-evolving enhancer protein 2
LLVARAPAGRANGTALPAARRSPLVPPALSLTPPPPLTLTPTKKPAATRRQLLNAGAAAVLAAALTTPTLAAKAEEAAGLLPPAALPSAAEPGAAAAAAAPGSGKAKPPRGFNPVQDLNDNYQFLYPFGWQEVSVQGADVVYKDVVEPLESVSVTLLPTDKADISEFGDVATVADTMARNVLTAPGADVAIVATSERADSKGRKYYEFEYTVKNSRYTRHSLAVACAAGGTFYTLTTGANEKRWGKMKGKLQTMVRSFSLIN